ncbi:MAG: YkgJ family cysteine cluster protein [Lentisphaeria bacterium]|nr:YkgJ family cysteine cluster protein [Lentisphaeria bacterium]
MSEEKTERLRYTCQRCGNCCRWEGYVRLTPAEVDAVAAFLGMPVAEFIDTYTVLTKDRRGLSLVENEEGHCVFLTRTGECHIQPVKPEQCKQFPNFWNFPGFRDTCRAIDTWNDETEPAEDACGE